MLSVAGRSAEGGLGTRSVRVTASLSLVVSDFSNSSIITITIEILVSVTRLSPSPIELRRQRA